MNATLAPPADTASTPPASPKATRILVVDDSVVNQRLTVALLKQRGYAVKAAGNGVEAVRILCDQAEPHDVVLMDCNMPEMDGFEATAAIRAHEGPNRDVVIIALTGTLEQTQVVRCDNSGMDDYLAKPIKIEDFESTVERCRTEKRSSAPQTGSADPEGATDQRAPFWDEARLGKLRATMGAEADEFICEMLSMFLADAPRLIESLQQAAEAGDAGALRETAHRFKGASRNLGLARIAEVSVKLEEMGKAGELSAALYWFKRLKGLTHQVANKAREELGLQLPG